MCPSTKWLEITFWVEFIGFFLSISAHFILIFLILEKPKSTFGNYKYLMISFSATGIFYSGLNFWCKPNIHLSETSFAIFTILKDSGVSKEIGVILITLYCSSYALLLSLLSLQFFYRYTSVISPLNSTRFSRKNAPFFIFYSFSFFTIWALLTYFINGPSDFKNLEFIPTFLEEYCLASDQFGYIGAKYYYFDYGIRKLHIPSFLCIFIMSCLMCSTFFGMSFFGFHTFRTLQKIGLTSFGTKELQKQLFKTLIIQTIIPSIFMYFPVSCMFLFPMIGLKISEISIFIPITVSIYPCLEPLVAMYCIKDFRHRIIDFITCSRTARVQMSSTQRESFF
ncbi:Protein CBR-STR-103 [Caenorhabditis briggsae]|uniref:Serpentine receptor class r-10 n=1 Tax=Caenorhabditis briggsae TaxID=6238 RepID=A8XTS6_CAEBR|nr:Protein CBR-STR-103 [Caenorhabditis briggsae]CAP36052.1 Protein CBR-STR-103 [Caenorhabditis briggsae]